MRHDRFFDWLDEVTDAPVARVVKTVFAGLLLLSLVTAVVRCTLDAQAEQEAANARFEQQARGQ